MLSLLAMNQILCCYWPPDRARWSYLAPLRNIRCVLWEKFPRKPYIIVSLLCQLGKIAECWPHSSSRVYGPRFCFKYTQKKNSADIQPSWPHARSISHMYWTIWIILQCSWTVGFKNYFQTFQIFITQYIYWYQLKFVKSKQCC